MSRLLAAIHEALALAQVPREAAAANTKLAIYRAREGRFIDARRAIAEIRALRDFSTHAECIARANLAEGVLEFCTGEFANAVDKLRRARALAEPIHLDYVVRLCGAWLAHMELNMGRPSAIKQYADQILSSAPVTEHDSLGRFALTLATGLHYCDRYDLARPWYEMSRRHAVDEGDDLTIDAILHNVAAFRLNNLRLAEVDGRLDLGEVDRADQEYRSSFNYDAIKAPSSFRWMLPLLRPQISMLRGAVADAETGLQEWLDRYAADAPERLGWVARADLAYCLSASGRAEAGDAYDNLAEGLQPQDLATDERILASFRLSQIADALGRAAEALQWRASCDALAQQHRREQADQLIELAQVQLPRTFG